MDFSESQTQSLVREMVRDVSTEFDRAYWVEHVETGRFPRAYWDRLAEQGLVGAAVPEAYGGEGMGVLELALIVEELDRAGAGGQAGVLFTLTPVFGGVTLAAHGSDDQRNRYLPSIADGSAIFSLGLTEPNAGTNTLRLETTADRDGNSFLIDGTKTFISGFETADVLVLAARTSPYEPADPTHGITTFLVENPSDCPAIDGTALDTQVPWAERQHHLSIDGLSVPAECVLGEVDAGLDVLWSAINVERIATAAGSLGVGLRAIDLAVEYANDRTVFDEPIGAHQAIQHPLADAYAALHTARLATYEAAWRYDRGESAATAANVAKLRASEAATAAADAAIQTHGGNGFTREYEVFDLWQNARLWQTSPVANEMVRNYLAEHELGLPRSY
ncbi:acyl-CoA dehydrogenase family protein [Halovivax gelatinilyticus]|uniref:acyl-CoA dehydrogenase family protein n=1 Tax=Halovivax gelatinilyticus TaxID=2961597 RepID=UPI0020CA6164|nr:acyl-CoA dehydrogenase family protein [Halovivax gelatinilyticus]